MQWYSIKKYLPPACSDVLIRATGGEYDLYFIGMIENFNQISYLNEWVLKGSNDYINLMDYKVTHFAIIDPIEIE